MQANIFLRKKSEKMLNEKVQVKYSESKNGNGKSQMNEKKIARKLKVTEISTFLL